MGTLVVTESGVEATKPDSSRREAILHASVAVFLRFGFRKTSMEDVARAAGVSRQGLYLHFANKEELFCAAVEQRLRRNAANLRAVLVDTTLSLECRLVAILHTGLGGHTGRFQDDAADLLEFSNHLVGSILLDYRKSFEQTLTDAIAGSASLMAVYATAGISALQIAHILMASARHFSEKSATHEEFIAEITVAVRILCAPASSC